MPDARERDYLRDRVEQYRGWYDARARFYKRWYLRLRLMGLTVGAFVPLLINAPARWAHAAASVAAVVVLLCFTLDGVLRLRERWENYRYTEQYLDREKHLYLTSSAHYRGTSPENAFACFVERVEWAIAAENSTTLATLALAPDIRGTARVRPPEASRPGRDGPSATDR